MTTYTLPPKPEPDVEIRRCLAEAMRLTCKSREQIADALSERIGRPITVHMLNDYAALSKEGNRFPAAWVRAFCEVTGDDSLQRMILGPHLAALVELGEHELALRQQKQRKKGMLDRLLGETPAPQKMLQITRPDSGK